MVHYQNPVIPGFYPDPSVCRSGEDYYLVNSSFEFFPGIPLFHSRDLVHWEQIGHVLTRKSQAMLENCPASGGIWAPTIRLHNGRFYVSATNYSYGGNFFVWTDDIEGEWSDPVWVGQGGIDPSLFFDTDGCVYLSSTYDLPDGQAIGQCQIDIRTGRMLTGTKIIWEGSGGKYPEGPHMFRKDGWYYLLDAEGGTEYGHMVTIARAASPWGPFESCPDNPILTHRDTMLHHFQAVGHGDITDTADGEYWMVFHGIRTSQYMLHHLGRETMLAPVTWNEEGWPVVNQGRRISKEMEVMSLPAKDYKVKEDDDTFHPSGLPKAWNYLRNPDMSMYSFTERPGCLKLIGGEAVLSDTASPTFVGRRQQHFCMRAEVWVDCNPQSEYENAGLTIFHTNEHHYDLAVTKRNGNRCVILRKRVGDMQTESEPLYLSGHGSIFLRVESDKLEYRFFAGSDERSLSLAGTGRTQLMSTECMPMTFTGCYVGLFAEKGCCGWFEEFKYSARYCSHRAVHLAARHRGQ
ncbi:glycoside hydrolase family 43 protein [Faecalicatena orotica]|uniref:Alpha-N-arabinofuranosidase n=1 Tax=Faecalicatena orotica TaxID=1544 RepID=A0A2Y9BDZ2_9FIRM|nr:glycoside hydrolase family 43 protein [Faecalicatena orotica]PWJ30902.1 alpha-N-arabinofuranosidase [Faecalicatena orotica]SSA55064.1 alpha-N-arabinofuranosidase [Faecalicatena orotica]